MADIVQLEEKGNLLYPKTHVSAIDNFDETVVKKTGNETILGVKNFKDGLQVDGVNLMNAITKNDTANTKIKLNTGFGVGSGGLRLKAISIGSLKFVQIDGIIQGLTAKSKGSYEVASYTLPDGWVLNNAINLSGMTNDTKPATIVIKSTADKSMINVIVDADWIYVRVTGLFMIS